MKAKSAHLELRDNVEIGLPQEFLNELSLASGVEVLVSVQDGIIVIAPAKSNPWDRLAGLWQGLWPKEDAQDYINRERDTWE
ncbi:MAG: AbrB/MazE/SpoVT family DNA-binding domain-containing protein [Thermomicrobiales bacterium]|nr:AbrB/MazE/SpoVT family DNA-binding domain-containing protein [Thermomicrobiales bacterium]